VAKYHGQGGENAAAGQASPVQASPGAAEDAKVSELRAMVP